MSQEIADLQRAVESRPCDAALRLVLSDAFEEAGQLFQASEQRAIAAAISQCIAHNGEIPMASELRLVAGSCSSGGAIQIGDVAFSALGDGRCDFATFQEFGIGNDWWYTCRPDDANPSRTEWRPCWRVDMLTSDTDATPRALLTRCLDREDAEEELILATLGSEVDEDEAVAVLYPADRSTQAIRYRRDGDGWIRE